MRKSKVSSPRLPSGTMLWIFGLETGDSWELRLFELGT